MTTNDPRCLFVKSTVRAPSVRRPREIYYYPSDQRSFVPAPPPSPVGHAASAAYNHSKTRLPNRPQRMHDSDAAAPRRSLASLDRKQKPNGNSERESGRHATAIESQFTCKARVKWGKINALFSSWARPAVRRSDAYLLRTHPAPAPAAVRFPSQAAPLPCCVGI